MPDRDLIIVQMMLETIEKIAQFTLHMSTSEDLEKDVRSFDATMMNFIVLGEAVGKLSDSFKESNHGVDWRRIYAFRNVLAHDYFGIYPVEVWDILQQDIPELKSHLLSILAEKSSSD